jgi:hypothetical protein
LTNYDFRITQEMLECLTSEFCGSAFGNLRFASVTGFACVWANKGIEKMNKTMRAGLAGDSDGSAPAPGEECREGFVFRWLEADRLEAGLEPWPKRRRISNEISWQSGHDRYFRVRGISQ